MKKDILHRLKALENDEVIEIEDISDYEREIFGDESEEVKQDEDTTKHTKKACRT